MVSHLGLIDFERFAADLKYRIIFSIVPDVLESGIILVKVESSVIEFQARISKFLSHRVTLIVPTGRYHVP